MAHILKGCLLLCLFLGIHFDYADACDCEECPPFQKIYVTFDDLVTMPDGTYFVDEMGEMTHVDTVLSDWDGMYIMLLNDPAPEEADYEDESYQAERYVYPNPTPKVHPRVWGE